MTDSELADRLRAVRTVGDFKKLEEAGDLNSLGPASVTVLLERFEVEKRKYTSRFVYGTIAGLIAVGLLHACLAMVWNGSDELVSGLGGGLYSLPFAVGGFYATTPMQRLLARKLGEIDNVSGIGPLLDALKCNGFQTARLAEKALIRLLPQLDAETAAQLTKEQHHVLNRALSVNSAELTLAILKAFDKLVTEENYRLVERLSAGKGTGSRNASVREAASDALKSAQVILERQRQGAVLLRPANSPEEPSSTLVRPASGRPEAEPDLLLRPVMSDTNPRD